MCDAGRERHAVIQPVFQGNETFRRSAVGCDFREGLKFAPSLQRIEREKHRLKGFDRETAFGRNELFEGGAPRRDRQRRSVRADMKIPGCGEENHRRYFFREQHGKCCDKRSTHAISNHGNGLAICDFDGSVERRRHVAGNIVAQGSRQLIGSRRSPVYQQRAKSLRRQKTQEAAICRQVQNVAAIDE